jgi:hypothetical protein
MAKVSETEAAHFAIREKGCRNMCVCENPIFSPDQSDKTVNIIDFGRFPFSA